MLDTLFIDDFINIMKQYFLLLELRLAMQGTKHNRRNRFIDIMVMEQYFHY